MFLEKTTPNQLLLRKSNTTLVGPSPAPGSWMHRLRRSMPSRRIRNSASLAGGLVGALHVFLCFFHAISSQFLHHVLYFNQLGLVVLHVLYERASGVVGAEDLLVDELFGEVLSEEGGEGGGGDVQGGETEDVLDLYARIELGVLSILDGCVAMDVFRGEGK